jgi:hypothetical protein
LVFIHIRFRFFAHLKKNTEKYSPLVSLRDRFDLKESLGRRKSNFQNMYIRNYISSLIFFAYWDRRRLPADL